MYRIKEKKKLKNWAYFQRATKHFFFLCDRTYTKFDGNFSRGVVKESYTILLTWLQIWNYSRRQLYMRDPNRTYKPLRQFFRCICLPKPNHISCIHYYNNPNYLRAKLITLCVRLSPVQGKPFLQPTMWLHQWRGPTLHLQQLMNQYPHQSTHMNHWVINGYREIRIQHYTTLLTSKYVGPRM